MGRGRCLIGRSRSFWKNPHATDPEEGKRILRQHTQRRHGPRRDHFILFPVLGNPAQRFGPHVQHSDVGESKIPDSEFKERCLSSRGLHQNNPRPRSHHGDRDTWDSGAAAEIEDGACLGKEGEDVQGTEDEDVGHVRGSVHPCKAKPLAPLDDQRHVPFQKPLLGEGEREADFCRPGLQDPAEGFPGRHVVL